MFNFMFLADLTSTSVSNSKDKIASTRCNRTGRGKPNCTISECLKAIEFPRAVRLDLKFRVQHYRHSEYNVYEQMDLPLQKSSSELSPQSSRPLHQELWPTQRPFTQRLYPFLHTRLAGHKHRPIRVAGLQNRREHSHKITHTLTAVGLLLV